MTAKAKSPRAPAALPSSLAVRLAAAMTPTDVPPARLAAMRDRLLARVREEAPRFVTVRSADGEWVALAPNVAYKIPDYYGAMLSFRRSSTRARATRATSIRVASCRSLSRANARSTGPRTAQAISRLRGQAHSTASCGRGRDAS